MKKNQTNNLNTHYGQKISNLLKSNKERYVLFISLALFLAYSTVFDFLTMGAIFFRDVLMYYFVFLILVYFVSIFILFNFINPNWLLFKNIYRNDKKNVFEKIEFLSISSVKIVGILTILLFIAHFLIDEQAPYDDLAFYLSDILIHPYIVLVLSAYLISSIIMTKYKTAKKLIQQSNNNNLKYAVLSTLLYALALLVMFYPFRMLLLLFLAITSIPF